jgi:hypothetical protein
MRRWCSPISERTSSRSSVRARVLAELGVDDARLAALGEAGVVATAET